MSRKLRNNKVKGETAEIEFLLKVHRLGFIVSRPWGDSAPYDFILETKRRLLRVQVKSAWTKGKRAYRLSAHRSLGRGYLPGQIDVVVAYVAPEKTWYVIPFRALGGRRSMYLFPENPNSKGRLEKFRNRWDLFR